MALKKPSQLFEDYSKKEISVPVRTNSPLVSNFNETFDKFKNNLDRVEEISNKIDLLSENLNTKLSREDLEGAIFSHLVVVEENFKELETQFKTINKKSLKEFKSDVSELNQIVENLIYSEIPAYRKKVTESEVRISNKFDSLQEIVDDNFLSIEQKVQEEIKEINFTLDEKLDEFNSTIEKTRDDVLNTVSTYNNLQKILENKVLNDEEKIQKYSQVLEEFNQRFTDFENQIETKIQEYEEVNSIIEDKFNSFSDQLNQGIDNKFEEYDKNIETKLSSYEDSIDSFKDEVITDISSIKADIIVSEKHSRDVTKKIESFEESYKKIDKNISNVEDKIEEIKYISSDVIETKKGLKDTSKKIEIFEKTYGNLDKSISKVEKDFEEIKYISDDVKETKKSLFVVENYIQNHHSDLEKLKEEVFGEIKKLPTGDIQENIKRLEEKIDYIRETYSKIKPEVIVNEVIQEGLLNEPPNVKNEDPLTPLNQKFVTLDQLKEHYHLFINRIQQQLSTLGGGGETQLKYLDDIVGIATDASSYDGKYLKYNHSIGKFEFADVDISSDSWVDGINGPYTNSSVGIGTTNPTEKLQVVGNVSVSGVVTTSAGQLVNGVPTFIQNTQPTIQQLNGLNKYLWWDTSGGNLTLWIQDGN